VRMSVLRRLVGAVAGATVAAAGLSAAPANAAVATAYVAEGGSDTGSCTATSRCATISYALTQVGEDATIMLSGTITDRFVVPRANRGLLITGVGGSSPAIIDGGGTGTGTVIINEGALTLDHVTVRGGNGGNGGGIGALAPLTLQNSSVEHNQANSGAGIYVYAGETEIRDSVIANNTTRDDVAGHGGGVYVTNGSLTVTRSTFRGNTAAHGDGGGVATYYLAPLLVTDSTFVDNVATSYGGAISSLDVTVRNSTLTRNSAPFGGAVANVSGTARILGSTLTNNTGDGVLTQYGTTYVAGSVLGPNPGRSCAGGQFTSQGHNFDTSAACGLTHPTDVIGIDPLVGPLQINGAPTPTMRPATGSPLTNQIPLGTTREGFALCGRTDQVGVIGPVIGSARCAIGAMEPEPGVRVAQAPLGIKAAAGPIHTSHDLAVTGGSGEGAVTFTTTNGTATGCAVSLVTLSAATPGTCVVVAHKAHDNVYESATSPATPVTFTAAPRKNSATLTVTRKGTKVRVIVNATTTVGGAATLIPLGTRAMVQKKVKKKWKTFKTIKVSPAGTAKTTTRLKRGTKVRVVVKFTGSTSVKTKVVTVR
jgi:predicted outer membrane repeat protein